MMIRPAVEGDIPSLAHVATTSYVDAFGHSFTKQDLADELEKNRSERYFRDTMTALTILVATVEDRVVGYVQFGALQISVQGATDRDKAMNRLYILPELQGQGIGSALLDAALRHPLLADADRVYLDVWDANTGAQRLYERYEFRVVGKNPYIVDGAVVGHDLVMMRPHPQRRHFGC